jgi:hypothetical protein
MVSAYILSVNRYIFIEAKDVWNKSCRKEVIYNPTYPIQF